MCTNKRNKERNHHSYQPSSKYDKIHDWRTYRWNNLSDNLENKIGFKDISYWFLRYWKKLLKGIGVKILAQLVFKQKFTLKFNLVHASAHATRHIKDINALLLKGSSWKFVLFFHTGDLLVCWDNIHYTWKINKIVPLNYWK